jgi:uncharacterized membrane protein
MALVNTLLLRHKTIGAGVVVVMVLLGGVLYPLLPEQMAVHWNASGEADGTAAKPIAVLLMPGVVVLMALLFEIVDIDAGERVVGSVAMLLLLLIQSMVFLINLGINAPIVPVALAGAFVVVGLAVWFEIHPLGA